MMEPEPKKKSYNWDDVLRWEAEAEDPIELEQNPADERKVDPLNIETEIEIKEEEILEINIEPACDDPLTLDDVEIKDEDSESISDNDRAIIDNSDKDNKNASGESKYKKPKKKELRKSCNHCGQKFNSIFSLKSHEKNANCINTSDNPSKSQVDDEKHQGKIVCFKDQATHSDDNIYKCKECCKTFKSLMALCGHVRVHKFNSTLSLKIHEKNTTCINTSDNPSNSQIIDEKYQEKNYECPKCVRVFKSLSTLCGHVCFNDQKIVAKHQETHSDDNIYKCKECCKTFKSLMALCGHVRVHKEEKAFDEIYTLGSVPFKVFK